MTDTLQKLLEGLKQNNSKESMQNIMQGLRKLAAKFDNAELHKPADHLGRLYTTYNGILADLQRASKLQERLDFIELQSAAATAHTKLVVLKEENERLKALIDKGFEEVKDIEALVRELDEVYACLYTEAYKHLALVGVWLTKLEGKK